MSNKINVLYIDDETTNIELFEILFSPFFNIITCLDGYKGLEILDNNPSINVVISDMRMPGMNGLEFIKKAREKYPEKKYFILSGYDMTEEIRKSLENNVIRKYFMKPLDIDEFRDSLLALNT